MTNFYSLLGLPENASEEDIRKAYRRKAKECHPDVNKSPDAQARFILINKAYEVLIDRQKRHAYDQKTKAPIDPYQYYAALAKEQKVREEAEALRKQMEFERKKEQLKESRMYYPYMIMLYIGTMVLVGISLLILLFCAFAIVWYHVFMFFFMLPFICLAAYILKLTLDEYRKYRALFS